MSISPRGGASGLEKLVSFKEYIVLKLLNKSCSELNFVQKSQWAHMSINPRSGARGLKRLICDAL